MYEPVTKSFPDILVSFHAVFVKLRDSVNDFIWSTFVPSDMTRPVCRTEPPTDNLCCGLVLAIPTFPSTPDPPDM